MKVMRYVLLFLASYLVFAVATLPANTVYAYWKHFLGATVPLQVASIDGTVWGAKAMDVSFQDKPISSVSWDLHLLQLLAGKIELAAELEIPNGYLKATMGRSLFGGMYANNIDAWLPLNQIAQYAHLQALRPEGTLGVNLQRVVITDHQLTDALGNVTWREAEITLLETVRLGELSVDVEPDAEGIKGQLHDGGGPLQLEGVVTLSKKGDYNLRLALAVRDLQQTALENALRGLGKPDAKGKYNISRTGNLSQLGLF